jgi:hypothetical protein
VEIRIAAKLAGAAGRFYQKLPPKGRAGAAKAKKMPEKFDFSGIFRFVKSDVRLRA